MMLVVSSNPLQIVTFCVFLGAGLLQHYIRTGKTEKEIKKTILQFCVSLKIQTTRVCEGITELFAGEVIYVLGRIKLGNNIVFFY